MGVHLADDDDDWQAQREEEEEEVHWERRTSSLKPSKFLSAALTHIIILVSSNWGYYY